MMTPMHDEHEREQRADAHELAEHRDWRQPRDKRNDDAGQDRAHVRRPEAGMDRGKQRRQQASRLME